MLNLLFISDSPKVEYIKYGLQPQLKAKIDVVIDFDLGLKSVFEKRPATICIQDQIGEVSGESVARHIQMLLGSAAPSFILLHTGSDKARAIDGLFEHIVDLNLSDDLLTGKLLDTLKLLLGDQWDTVYIPPKPLPLPDTPVVPAPEKSSKNLDVIADDFSADAGKPGISDADFPPSPALDDVIAKKKSTRAAKSEPPPRRTPAVKKAVTPPDEKENRAEPVVLTPPPRSSAEEFLISQPPPDTDERMSKNLFLAFEDSYRPESRSKKYRFVIAIACIVSIAAGGWYFFRQNSQIFSSLNLDIFKIFNAKQGPEKKPVEISAQKTAPLPVQSPVLAPALPSFIPKDGHDSSFAQKNPGWDRYIGKQYEFRVFTVPGRIQAIQVLSISDPVTDSMIKSVLQEFAGSEEYQILSRSTKSGVRIENGKIKDKAEVIIYRKNGSVKAFVVSVN